MRFLKNITLLLTLVLFEFQGKALEVGGAHEHLNTLFTANDINNALNEIAILRFENGHRTLPSPTGTQTFSERKDFRKVYKNLFFIKILKEYEIDKLFQDVGSVGLANFIRENRAVMRRRGRKNKNI